MSSASNQQKTQEPSSLALIRRELAKADEGKASVIPSEREIVAYIDSLYEQLEAALRAVDAARVILTLADEERDELAREVSKYLGPWADLVEAVHAVSNPAKSPKEGK